MKVALINGKYSPIIFAPDTPNQTVYNACDQLAEIGWRELQMICSKYPHLTPLMDNAKQFATNACRLAAAEGVKASTYYKLSQF